MTDAGHATTSDKPKPAPSPIVEPKVDVTITPKKGERGAAEYSRKIKPLIEREIKEAVEKAKPQGSPGQLKSADQAIKETTDKLDRGKVSEVKVSVRGKVDGKDLAHEKIVTP